MCSQIPLETSSHSKKHADPIEIMGQKIEDTNKKNELKDKKPFLAA